MARSLKSKDVVYKFERLAAAAQRFSDRRMFLDRDELYSTACVEHAGQVEVIHIMADATNEDMCQHEKLHICLVDTAGIDHETFSDIFEEDSSLKDLVPVCISLKLEFVLNSHRAAPQTYQS